ncbi:Hypothetical protein CAP_6020 [Chondromyces apiculatus DSM 436]|uniref:Activator of Hsp90 ATPase homologue 1/2-like C-terminal domain-containing protein n=2 Tax=Chondromyces apiculatus TaxID=51 RepID=A0A017TG89_9BACT|nr:SRPBCC family protein [Chondromyces apiculatus]EYF08259.1 Hypothetical protein CAP_6020 [Chondromyces apiculatus DSM 436]
MVTDVIEKQVVLRAPRSRVWKALSNAKEFGSWFGTKLEGGEFTPGAHVQGPITHKGYEHLMWNVTIERVEPEWHLSWRWHPSAIDANVDYSGEPTTLVVFELTEVPEGTLLRVTESGFDRLPPERRAYAFRSNEEGWQIQTENIAKHLGVSSGG